MSSSVTYPGMRVLCIFSSWKTAGAGAGHRLQAVLRFPWLHPAVPGRMRTGWQGQEGSQGAGEVAERPPRRTLQLAAAVISTAGSRHGRAPKGFGRSPNPRRLRGRSREKGEREIGEGREGGMETGKGRRKGWSREEGGMVASATPCGHPRPWPGHRSPRTPGLELLMDLGRFCWSCCSSPT